MREENVRRQNLGVGLWEDRDDGETEKGKRKRTRVRETLRQDVEVERR